MTPELKGHWLETLRDPMTVQTTGRLRNPQGGRCCLGVLSDICGIEHVAKQTRTTEGHATLIFYLFASDDQRMSTPPDDFEGLSADTIAKLVDLNDRGIPFPAIADWIEKNVVTTES